MDVLIEEEMRPISADLITAANAPHSRVWVMLAGPGVKGMPGAAQSKLIQMRTIHSVSDF